MTESAHKKFVIVALLLNLCGTILLFYGLQVTSLNPIKVALSANGMAAICNGRNVVFGGKEGGIEFGINGGCPTSAAPVAVIVGDHPSFIATGLIFILIATFLSLYAEGRRPVGEERRRRKKR